MAALSRWVTRLLLRVCRVVCMFSNCHFSITLHNYVLVFPISPLSDFSQTLTCLTTQLVEGVIILHWVQEDEVSLQTDFPQAVTSHGRLTPPSSFPGQWHHLSYIRVSFCLIDSCHVDWQSKWHMAAVW